MLISCPFGLETDGVIARSIHALDPRILVCGLLNTNQRGDLLAIDADARDMQTFVVPGWIKHRCMSNRSWSTHGGHTHGC